MTKKNVPLTKQAASELAALCLRHSAELNTYLLALQQNGSEEDLAVAKQIVGRIMGETYVAGLRPIFRDYPDLRPEGFPDSKA